MNTTPRNSILAKELRLIINKTFKDLHLGYGLRKHLAKMLAVHPSTVNNALNGHRSTRNEIEILLNSLAYLNDINTLFEKHRRTLCKSQHKND